VSKRVYCTQGLVRQLLHLIVSFNANADFFSDIGDFFEDNSTEVALAGVGYPLQH
jgi:hypothetical protein